MQNSEELKAILRQYGSNVYNLAGPRYTALRQQVLLLITGQKWAKGKCGIFAIESRLCEELNIDRIGRTPNEVHMDIRNWINS
jgi:hypothetical protein